MRSIQKTEHITSEKSAPQVKKWRRVASQTLAVMAKNVLVIVFATTLAYPTVLIPALSDGDSGEMFHLNETELSWIGSINLMCVPLGCLLSGIVTQPIGRKRAMQYINFPFVLCWIVFYFANELWQIYFALAIMGLFGGLVEAPLFAYVSEITEPDLRGLLSATTSIAGALGILLQFLLGSLLPWRIIALISCSVPVICFCMLCFIPESPYWLISRNRLDDSQKSLAWLRGWTSNKDVELEFQEIIKTHNNSKTKSHELVEINEAGNSPEKGVCLQRTRMLTKTSFLWPFAVVSFIYFLGHFTGATTLRVYAVNLLATLQVPIDKYYATVFVGVGELLGASVSVILVRRTGKRIMAFISITGIGICNIVVATYSHLMEIKYFNIHNEPVVSVNSNLDDYKWIPFIFLLLLAFTTQCGLRILPWILIGEVYPNEIRSLGCGISGAVSFMLGFASNKIYLNMISSLTIAGTYLFYGCVSFIGCIVVYFILPETEGKTLQEITDHFCGISKLENGIGVRGKYKTSKGKVNLAFQNQEDRNYKLHTDSKL